MSRRHYTDEFKHSATALVLEQKLSRQQAATDLGIGVSTLDNWLSQARRAATFAGSLDETELKKQNAELTRQLRRVTMERDILKKATAYFAKDAL
jgi:transposase